MKNDCDNHFEKSISEISSGLLRSVKLGNQEAWIAMMDAFGPVVFLWVCRYGVPKHDASDVQQIVFTSAHQSIHRFNVENESDNFPGWLRAITRNKVIDYWRTRKRIPHPISEEQLALHLDQISIEENQDTRSISFKVEQKMVAKELLRLVESKIRNKTHWEIVIKIFEGQCRKNIAEEYGLRRANIDVIYSRAMAKFRKEFPQETVEV